MGDTESYHDRVDSEPGDGLYTAPEGELVPNTRAKREQRFDVHDDALHGEAEVTFTAKQEDTAHTTTATLADGETLVLDLDPDRRLRATARWFTVYDLKVSLDYWNADEARWEEYDDAFGITCHETAQTSDPNWGYSLEFEMANATLDDEVHDAALTDIYALVDTELLSLRQAIPYVLRELHDFERAEAAAHYPLSDSDMDNAHRTARDKAEQALEFAAKVDDSISHQVLSLDT